MSMMREVERCFREWHAEQNFTVPLAIGKRSRHSLGMSFATLRSQALRAFLKADEISVAIEWNGYFYDLIYCNDLVAPKKMPTVWICDVCLTMSADCMAPVAIYPSREASRRDHLFAPFGRWINDELSHAT